MTSAIGKSRAFSLVELVLACLILGVALSVAWPPMRGLCRRIEARAQARQFTLALRAARELALLSGQPQRVDAPGAPGAASFFPDGTATPIEVRFGTEENAVAVSVDATGRIHDDAA